MTFITNDDALRSAADLLGEDGLQRHIDSTRAQLLRYQVELRAAKQMPHGEGRKQRLATLRASTSIARQDMDRYRWMLADWRRRHKEKPGE